MSVLTPVTSISRHRVKANVPYRGYVVDNKDPKQLGRVKIKVPGLLDFKVDHLPWAVPYWWQTEGGTDWTGFFDVPKLNAYVTVFFQEAPDGSGSVYNPFYSSFGVVEPTQLEDSLDHYPNRKIHRFSNGAYAFVDTEDDTLWLYNPGESHFKSKGKLAIKSQETFVIISDVELGIRAPEIALRAKDKLILESEGTLVMRSKDRMDIETRDNLWVMARKNIDITACEEHVTVRARGDLKETESNVKIRAIKDHIKLRAEGTFRDRESNIYVESRKSHIYVHALGEEEKIKSEVHIISERDELFIQANGKEGEERCKYIEDANYEREEPKPNENGGPGCDYENDQEPTGNIMQKAKTIVDITAGEAINLNAPSVNVSVD